MHKDQEAELIQSVADYSQQLRIAADAIAKIAHTGQVHKCSPNFFQCVADVMHDAANIMDTCGRAIDKPVTPRACV